MCVCTFRGVRPDESVSPDVMHPFASHSRYRKNIPQSRPIMFLLHRLTSSRLRNCRTSSLGDDFHHRACTKVNVKCVRTCVHRPPLVIACVSHFFAEIRFSVQSSACESVRFSLSLSVTKINRASSSFANVTYAYRRCLAHFTCQLKVLAILFDEPSERALVFSLTCHSPRVIRQNFFLDTGASRNAGIEKFVFPRVPTSSFTSKETTSLLVLGITR